MNPLLLLADIPGLVIAAGAVHLIAAMFALLIAECLDATDDQAVDW